ncbi:MAG: hypothetical protein PHO92_05265 [Candidatus Peribacteraceae bacterium]|nr:hypothetical protein [Candidatus Peribacteraceae bacterium]
MHSVPTGDGLYEEVCDALAVTFGVRRGAIREDTALRELRVGEANLSMGLASFAQRMQMLLSLDDFCIVLAGIDPQPGEPPEDQATLVPKLLDVTVIQIVAVVRNRLWEGGKSSITIDDGETW